MEKRLKNLIVNDYLKSLEILSQIISERKPNWWVKSPNQYLTPSVICHSTPLDDEEGEFKYYNKICETLEKLLAGERVEYTCHFSDAPKEIKQLLDKAA